MQCTHCGKEVSPTLHHREGSPPYHVGYYRLLTGLLHHVSMKNPSNESETIEFYDLREPRWIITCDECFPKAEIQTELQSLFADVPENEPAAPDNGAE